MTLTPRKILKITIFVAVLGLLFFLSNLFYNQRRESIAQEPTLSCEGEEIPLGDALDKAFDLASVINDNIQTVFSSSQSQITSAKSLFDLPEQCKAENCQTSCVIASSGQSKIFANNRLDVLENYALSSFNTVLGYQLAQAVPKKPDTLWVSQTCRADGTIDVTFNWDPHVADINQYSYSVWVDFDGIWRSRLIGSYAYYLWESMPSNTSIQWYVFVRDNNDFTLTNQSDQVSFTSIGCGVCTILLCSGSPCPAGQANSLFNEINSSYGQIANSSSAIGNAVLGRDDIIKELDEARKGLAKCVTPAGEKTEAEAEEVKDLLTCQEAQYQRALPSGKTGCDNPNNFLCCYYK